MSEELLKIKDLTISFPTDKGLHTVVDHLNMEVRKGQIVGIVGESGSGKTMTSLAVMGLLDKAAVVDPCSSITLKGKEILNISREERRKIQGNQISMVFQEPMTSLNPVMKVGRQIGEVRLESGDEIHYGQGARRLHPEPRRYVQPSDKVRCLRQ